MVLGLSGLVVGGAVTTMRAAECLYYSPSIRHAAYRDTFKKETLFPGADGSVLAGCLSAYLATVALYTRKDDDDM